MYYKYYPSEIMRGSLCDNWDMLAHILKLFCNRIIIKRDRGTASEIFSKKSKFCDDNVKWEYIATSGCKLVPKLWTVKKSIAVLKLENFG